MRIALFGGTFDPIHLAHLILAQEVQVRLGLDEVHFVPAGQPPHKHGRAIASAEDRIAMVELAIADNPYFRVSRADVDRPGLSYTADLVAAERARLGPDDELFFIMGLDSLLELHTWYDPARLIAAARIAVVGRPGYQHIAWKELERIAPDARERIALVPAPMLEISATEIRQRVAAGLPIRYLVPKAVRAYIAKHHLYGACGDRRTRSV